MCQYSRCSYWVLYCMYNTCIPRPPFLKSEKPRRSCFASMHNPFVVAVNTPLGIRVPSVLRTPSCVLHNPFLAQPHCLGHAIVLKSIAGLFTGGEGEKSTLPSTSYCLAPTNLDMHDLMYVHLPVGRNSALCQERSTPTKKNVRNATGRWDHVLAD